MDFKLVSNDNRKVDINLDLINTYTSRYLPSTPFDFSITRRQAKVSDPMRRYYFAAVLPPLLKELFYEKDEGLLVHHQLKIRYFERHPDYLDENGDPIIKQDERGIWRNVPSVFSNKSKLDISAKKEFVDWVVRIAAAYGVYIEDPEGE